MTTILWDQKTGILAADSQQTFDDCYKVAAGGKIVPMPQGCGFRYAAGAGDEAEIEAMIAWVIAKRAHDRPVVAGSSVLFIADDGAAWLMGDDSPEPFELGDFPFGVGTGAAYAIGALLAGADPVTAVEIAARCDPNSCGPVQHVATRRQSNADIGASKSAAPCITRDHR